jgi:hypothetical protein
MNDNDTYPILGKFAVGCTLAEYTAQRISRYKDNPLIEVLGSVLEIDDIVNLLMGNTDGGKPMSFDPSILKEGVFTRLAELDSLQHFYFPQTHQIELVSLVDRVLRNGYLGRIPNTVSHFSIFANIDDLSKVSNIEQLEKLSLEDLMANQLCDTLIGYSGAGKTATLKRIERHFGSPRFHPKYGIYQIPCILVEAAAGGLAGVLTSIIDAIDKKLPWFNYRKDYLEKSRKPSVIDLLCIVARLCTIHCVGILIIEEIQKLDQKNLNDQALLNQILTLANIARVPILLVGTNKAASQLWKDGALARRSCGIAPWERLALPDNGEEVKNLLEALLKFQYLPERIEYSPELAVHLINLTQGIVGSLIDIYRYGQEVAIKAGADRLTDDHFTTAYVKHLHPMHKVFDALRSGDYSVMATEPDYAPITVGELARTHRNAISQLHQSKKKSTGNSSVTTTVQVATAIHATGVSGEDALEIAKNIMRETPDITPAAAVRKGLSPVAKKQQKVVTYEERPQDYRRDFYLAGIEGTTVAEQLIKSGKLRPILEILEP